MKKYEIMVIIKNDLGEQEAQDYIKTAIDGRITEMGGKVTFQDFWGARGFAYKIKGMKWGYYYVAQFDVDPAKTLELRRELNIDRSVVRFLITEVDKKAPAPMKYADMQKANKALEKDKEVEAAPVLVETKTAKKAPEKKASKEAGDNLDKVLADVTSGL